MSNIPVSATRLDENAYIIIIVIMVALLNGADHYVLPCGFFFFLSFFFPRLISAIADWMSAILPHMVWP